MRTRLLAIGLAVLSVAVVACGGGGGGGTPPVTAPSVSPTQTPTPAPTATPTSNGCVGVAPFAASRHAMAAPRPIASGDQFSYTGSLQETYVQSAPCPLPTATTNATISVGVSDSATTAPNSQPGTAATVSETDVYPTHTSTSSTTQVLQNSGTALLLYSTNANDGNGDSIQTTYTNAQEIDDLGAGGPWTNGPAATVQETMADGTSIARTIASDGSYTDTETYPTGSPATITVNGASNSTALNGSGVYAFAGATFSYAAPTGGNITLTITNGTSSKTRTFPAWFTVPASGSYITDTFADNGVKPFDANCSVPATISTSGGTQIVETYSVLDPVLGYTETRTTTSYDVSGYGPACVAISDTLSSYYDYSDDTQRIDWQSQNGQPNSVNTITETLNMQSASCGSGSPPCAQARKRAAQPISRTAVLARIAQIQTVRALERAQRLNALHAFAIRYLHLGGHAR